MKRSELLAELARRIIAVERPHPTRVAIDGVDAAGKTTLADELLSFIQAYGRPVIRASIDGFHNPSSIRHQRGPTSPEGYYHDSFNYRAARVFGAAATTRETVGASLFAFYREEYENYFDAARNELGHERFDLLWSEGRAMTLQQAVAYVLED